MSSYDQRYQHVVTQLNAVRDINIHISEYIPSDLLQPQQLNNIIEPYKMDMLALTNKFLHFNLEIEALIQSIGNKPKEERLAEFRTILSDMSNEMLKFTITISRLKPKYESMTRYLEIGVSNFLRVNHAKVAFNEDDLQQLLGVARINELSILELSSTIGRLIAMLKTIDIPDKISVDFNSTIASCIEEAESFLQSVDQSIHMVWRIRGVTEGFLRLTN